MYKGLLGSAGARFIDQRSSDIYMQDHYLSNDQFLQRQTYVCIARGVGSLYIEFAQNPRVPAVLGNQQGAEVQGGHMPVHGGHIPAHGGQDGFYVEDDEQEQPPPPDNNPDHPNPDLLWGFDFDDVGLIQVFNCGPSINPPLANPIEMPVVDIEIDGEIPRVGYNMPWNNNMTELRPDNGTLHYHQHYPRVPGDHGPLPPKILPQDEGTHRVVRVIHYGTQIQVFRRARVGQLVGGGQAVAG